MSTTDVLSVELRGAEVHGQTCWQIEMDPYSGVPADPSSEKVFNKVMGARLEPDGKALGHVCTDEELSGKEESSVPEWYICTEDPNLRETTC